MIFSAILKQNCEYLLDLAGFFCRDLLGGAPYNEEDEDLRPTAFEVGSRPGKVDFKISLRAAVPATESARETWTRTGSRSGNGFRHIVDVAGPGHVRRVRSVDRELVVRLLAANVLRRAGHWH